MAKESKILVEHLFRTEYGKLVAILTNIFGPSHIQLAEDVVQETLISALNNWSIHGLPKNPGGWLLQVAKRKALNELKRNMMIRKHHEVLGLSQNIQGVMQSIYVEGEIEDSQLRMIFTCCNSSLNVESQIALTLKTLCGFGVSEVANALLTTESTINKRLYRAKVKIRDSHHSFTIPRGNELNERLDAVCLTLYLLFNEGYHSTSGNTIIQKDLCLEAVRLTKLLIDYFPDQYRPKALLALMCLHIARFDARIDDKGAIVLFEDQDRTKWNKELINVGMQYLQQSIKSDTISPYHIEARIAAEHCTSESFEATNWQFIYDQYLILDRIKPNAVIKLNLAIIQSKLKGLRVSLQLLHQLSENEDLDSYHLLPATQGVFHMKLGNYEEAIVYLNRALKLHHSNPEDDFIKTNILNCENLLSGN